MFICFDIQIAGIIILPNIQNPPTQTISLPSVSFKLFLMIQLYPEYFKKKIFGFAHYLNADSFTLSQFNVFRDLQHLLVSRQELLSKEMTTRSGLFILSKSYHRYVCRVKKSLYQQLHRNSINLILMLDISKQFNIQYQAE